ncbi:MAG: ATP:cob(I)alamin adenosyltransferase [Acidobacteria bacterium]|nr:ATP:cob(I)alamin adenosyltransferase [Acidobacteriota bacterium]
MSIATKAGDNGRTALVGGDRVSKADLRVEAYGTIDELGAALGFARSICEDEQTNELTKSRLNN